MKGVDAEGPAKQNPSLSDADARAFVLESAAKGKGAKLTKSTANNAEPGTHRDRPPQAHLDHLERLGVAWGHGPEGLRQFGSSGLPECDPTQTRTSQGRPATSTLSCHVPPLPEPYTL